MRAGSRKKQQANMPDHSRCPDVGEPAIRRLCRFDFLEGYLMYFRQRFHNPGLLGVHEMDYRRERNGAGRRRRMEFDCWRRGVRCRGRRNSKVSSDSEVLTKLQSDGVYTCRPLIITQDIGSSVNFPSKFLKYVPWPGILAWDSERNSEKVLWVGF
jgi:hypothetical protein